MVCSDGDGKFTGNSFLKPLGTKFEVKGQEGILIGYNILLRSYQILLKTGAVINSKHVRFLKSPIFIENSDVDFLPDVQQEIGFEQIKGIDFDESFASTGKVLTLQMILLYSLHQNLEVTQFNVQGAFLHAPLSEEVYIKTPKGVNQDSPYLKLKKALYGLKQAPKNVFVARDLVLVGPGNHFKEKFEERFKNSSCHEPNTILGMKFEQVGHKILLSQPKHIDHGLEELGLQSCKPSQTPLTPNLKLTEASDEEHALSKKENINYRSAIGLMSDIAGYTRPDISFAVSNLARFSIKPGIQHWHKTYTVTPLGRTILNIEPCNLGIFATYLDHSFLGTVLGNTKSHILQPKPSLTPLLTPSMRELGLKHSYLISGTYNLTLQTTTLTILISMKDF
ncbi:uncharacterized protein VP01_3250g1 [Puccinia sorghi]|uniref:Reverse transcriptase Ty1/copia-type domain-containing protein n=1 Tax=Puccinia sorghi TaxID=27349 RepID=A0A0L6UXX7_9BASI|nr:uncharacterized protein VP01_3250g1 [Puccinia sorghi]